MEIKFARTGIRTIQQITVDNLKDIINTVRINRGKPPIAELRGDLRLREDLELDSLDLAELTVRIEVEHDVDIFADGIVATVGEIHDKLAR